MILPVVTKTVPNNRHVGTEIDEGITRNVVPIPVPMIRKSPAIMNKIPMIFIIIFSPLFYKSLCSYNFVQTRIEINNKHIAQIDNNTLD